jgi:hypothetical protein
MNCLKKDLMLVIMAFKHRLKMVQVLIAVSESSDRLQLAPFEPWDGKILLVLNYLSRHLVMYNGSYFYGWTMVAFPRTFRQYFK